MKKYLATVRVEGQLIKTIVFATCDIHARLLLQYHFGMGCIAVNPRITNESIENCALMDSMIKPKPPMSLTQARINGLRQSVERSREQLKSERERQRREREAERKKQGLSRPAAIS